MKLKSLLFVCCFGLLTSAFADNHHFHPQANKAEANAAAAKPTDKAKLPGYCEIEIINSSFDDVRVYGVFDDGTTLNPFSIYSYEAPHYIDLFYYGYCHAGMNLWIDTYSGYRVYAGYTYTNSTVRIVPYLKQTKVEITSK
ncbi:hypothetical protein [Legionella jordanis]|uniref:Secreted protein n=1 Tax=Legionella jordanis TaxID=456 RepID=A0A0W0V8W0_9GAMM|nr:hypothetical protein [Legionella jordanis]KTD16565.1 hypothetical protein Ljor_0871 [Legionella jordanis]RMX03896.1 hypothetical protein EAW55_05935 [Legionella jordanis]VEH11972.1 Uncharacterised protein [Legionella jordanis]HAT8712723.1 hypothetical protein [Legionella jordanis]